MKPKFEWTKESIAYLVMHAANMAPIVMARELGCSSESIYNKIRDLGMQGIRKRVITREELEKRSLDQKQRVAREKANTWPRITTTMDAALKGRTFEDVLKKPSTTKPIRCITRWSADVGEAKSSLGYA